MAKPFFTRAEREAILSHPEVQALLRIGYPFPVAAEAAMEITRLPLELRGVNKQPLHQRMHDEARRRNMGSNVPEPFHVPETFEEWRATYLTEQPAERPYR